MRFALSFLVITLLLPVAGFAGELEKQVAEDIQSLLDDTVNEGSQNAQVEFNGEDPVVACRVNNAKDSATKKWAFCNVDFTVTFDDSDEAQGRQCGLLYSYETTDLAKTLTRGKDQFFDDCMETLSEGP